MYKRVLVPLDGSPVAEAIIPFVLEIAGPLDMEVALLEVVEPTPPMVIEGAAYAAAEDVETRRVGAQEYLVPIAVELRNKGVRVTTQIRLGRAQAEILNAAKEAGADLVAMSTHGRSGLDRLLFGSVAEGVLRNAEVPVLLMRSTEAEVARRQAQGPRR